MEIHYDRREIWPGSRLAVNEWQAADGVHTQAFRKVYVAIDGKFAGSMSFSTEGAKEERYCLCYGQDDQVLGVPPETGEQAGAEFIARYYRKRSGD
jgi:hypothetical protein